MLVSIVFGARLKPRLPGSPEMPFSQSSIRKLRYEDRIFLQSRLNWYDTRTECMRNCRWDVQRGKMRGVKGYRWSRCNVARGNVSCIIALQCMPEDHLNLKVVLLCFYIIAKPIETNVAYITWQLETHFPQKRAFLRNCTILPGEICEFYP